MKSLFCFFPAISTRAPSRSWICHRVIIGMWDFFTCLTRTSQLIFAVLAVIGNWFIEWFLPHKGFSPLSALRLHSPLHYFPQHLPSHNIYGISVRALLANTLASKAARKTFLEKWDDDVCASLPAPYLFAQNFYGIVHRGDQNLPHFMSRRRRSLNGGPKHIGVC